MRRIIILLLSTLILVSPVVANGSLESQIQTVTGIIRSVDVDLQARAAIRAVQIQTNYSHCCMAYGEGEILAQSLGFSDPLGSFIDGWLGSPSHRDMMFDASYDRIGCATSYLAPWTYGACLFVATEILSVPIPMIMPQPQPSVKMADTAMP